jgi:hypothetical protein
MPVVLATPNSSGSKAFVKLTEEFLQKLNAVESSDQAQNEDKMKYLTTFE